MAKTLEEFFINQIEEKDKEILKLKNDIEMLQKQNDKITKDNAIFVNVTAAYEFLVDQLGIQISNDKIVITNANSLSQKTPLPWKFISDHSTIMHYFETHAFVQDETTGRLFIKDMKEL